MTTFTYRYLSPEERQAYKAELLRLFWTRNESLAKRWGVDRADRSAAMNTAIGEFRGCSVSHLRDGMEQEFYLAGMELLDSIKQEAN